MNFSYLLGLLIYLAASISQVLIDILLAKYMPAEQFSSWGYFRSILFGIVPLLCFGIDQTIIRNGHLSKKLFIRWQIIVIILAYLLSVVMFDTHVLMITCIIALYTFVCFYYSATRAEKKFLLAQLIYNSWKIGLLLFIILALAKLNMTNILLFLFISLLSILLYLKLFAKFSLKYSAEAELSSQLKYSLMFFLSLLTLSFSTYFDQIALKHFTNVMDYSQYLIHSIIYLSPWLALANLIAFYLTPLIARQNDKYNAKQLYMKYYLYLAGLIIMSGIIYYFIGNEIFKVLFAKKTSHSQSLAILFILIGLVRTYYTLQSAIIGMTFNLNNLKIFYFISLIGIFAQIMIFLGFIQFSSLVTIYAMAVALSVNWYIRALGAHLQIIKGN